MYFSHKHHNFRLLYIKDKNNKKFAINTSSSLSTNKSLLNDCKKLTNEEKYERLEQVGGRNQQFMANSPIGKCFYLNKFLEASRNFAQILSNNINQNKELEEDYLINKKNLANWEEERRINDDFENVCFIILQI